MQTHGEAVVPGAHRVIRRLTAGEGPYEGELVVFGASAAVRVPREAECVRWGLAGAEHVAAPLDVLREVDGHSVLMPWCTRGVAALLAQRVAAGEPPEAGECVTLAVSLLRGIGELGADAAASWWITADGRPVAVPGGGASARMAAAEVLGSLGEASTERALKRLLVEISAAISTREPSAAQRSHWEDALCDYAAPRAIRLEVFAPAPATLSRAIRTVPALRRREYRERTRTERGAVLGPAVDRARVQLRAVIERVGALRHRAGRADAGRAEDAVTGAARLQQAAARDEQHGKVSRGRRMLVAAVAAAVVLLMGALWPDGSEPAEADEASEVGAVVRGLDGSSAAVASRLDPPAEDEALAADAAPGADAAPATPVEAAGPLLLVLQECLAAGDEQCGAAVADDASVPLALIADADAEPAELVDDYGDIAVVRLGEGSAERMLVLIRRNDHWLVRDVLDVADQPVGSS